MASPEQWTPRVQRLGGDERGLLAYAFSLVRERRFDEARHELEKALQQNEKSFQTNMALGLLCQIQRQFKESLPYLHAAMSIDPMNARAPLLSGYSHFMLKDLSSAGQAFQTALKLDPKQANAHMGLAQVMQREGSTPKAIEHLQDALRIDPQLVQARLQLARLLHQSGQHEAATDHCEHILRSSPGHPIATFALASMHLASGKNEAALAILETAAKHKSDNAQIWSLLGRVRLQMKQYEEAEAAYREAARLRPHSITNSLQFVAALIPQGKTKEAADLLQRMPRRGWLAPAVQKAYGDLYLAQGDEREAVESYRAALLASPGGEEAVARIESSTPAGVEPDWKALVRSYQAEIAQVTDEGRKKMEEHDWEATFERFQEQMSSGMGADWLRHFMANRQRQQEH